MPKDYALPAGQFTIFAEKPRLVGRAKGYLWFPTITAFPNGKNDDITDSASMALLRFMQATPIFIGRA